MPDVLNHPLLAARYFFPGGEPPRGRIDVEVEGATLACAFHPGVRPGTSSASPGGARRSQEERPTLVFFHGNGEAAGEWQGTLDVAINRLGWNLFLAEYRGYGGSTGAPLLGKLLDDVVPVIEAAGSASNLVVMGRSVGSIFALEAVHRFPGIKGLIIESGIADAMERVLLRVTPEELGEPTTAFEEAARRLDHELKMRSFSGRTLILHTRNDGVVDVRHGQQLHMWAADSRLHIFEDGDHNSILWTNADEYWAKIADFLAECDPRSNTRGG